MLVVFEIVPAKVLVFFQLSLSNQLDELETWLLQLEGPKMQYIFRYMSC